MIIIIRQRNQFVDYQVETFPFDPSTDLPTGVELQDLIDQVILTTY